MIPSEKNTKKEPLSMWSAYLDKGYEDPYLDYKEKIAVKTEILIGEIANELLKNGVNYTSDVAKKVAVNLIMEQMLSIQYDNCPDVQKAMIINLFCDLCDYSHRILVYANWSFIDYIIFTSVYRSLEIIKDPWSQNRG